MYRACVRVSKGCAPPQWLQQPSSSLSFVVSLDRNSVRQWCNTDACGVVCASVTWALILYAQYVVNVSGVMPSRMPVCVSARFCLLGSAWLKHSTASVSPVATMTNIHS